MKTLFFHIKGLVMTGKYPFLKGQAMSEFSILNDAWMIIEEDKIVDFGQEPVPNLSSIDSKIDCSGRFILPTFVDSHTHLVFADWREDEFESKIKGKSYEQIAKEGGGILNSALKLSSMSEDQLLESAKKRLQEVIFMGTGAIEITSGYGLTLESEIKMLKVIKRLKEISPIPIKSTFLGAHTFPLEFKNNPEGYVDLIIKNMLPTIQESKLADYVDVFCEKGFFNPDQTLRIGNAAKSLGFKIRLHANELDYSGGVETGVELGAISVDHLEVADTEQFEVLKNSFTIPTLLPSTAFFLGLTYPKARKMIDAGLGVVLASDFNPGTSPSGNMSFVMSLGCIKMKMSPSEVICAVTTNASYALELEHQLGSIDKGKLANFIISKPINSLNMIPYHFGAPLIESVYINGKKFQSL
jgi:imidazolonepropionase